MNVFTNEDYNCDIGFNTLIWGPSFWHILHTMSFDYPTEPTQKHKQDYYKFFSSLKNVLPCKLCRQHLKENLKILKLTKSVFKSRESLSRWVFELHELVNKMLKKKSGLTYEKVRAIYENFRARCIIDKDNPDDEDCSEELYAKKSKCQLRIIPELNKNTFVIDKSCIIKRN